MEVKEVVEMAKRHILDLFGGEQISNVGLEEVEFDDKLATWNVTIGFSRPWDVAPSSLAVLAQQLSPPRRSYKVVRIDDVRGQVLAVKNREFES